MGSSRVLQTRILDRVYRKRPALSDQYQFRENLGSFPQVGQADHGPDCSPATERAFSDRHYGKRGDVGHS